MEIKNGQIYKHLGELVTTNEIWISPLEIFFSLIDIKKYPKIKQKYRFELGRNNE